MAEHETFSPRPGQPNRIVTSPPQIDDPAAVPCAYFGAGATIGKLALHPAAAYASLVDRAVDRKQPDQKG